MAKEQSAILAPLRYCCNILWKGWGDALGLLSVSASSFGSPLNLRLLHGSLQKRSAITSFSRFATMPGLGPLS